MRKHVELLRDPRAYIESIGKKDGGRRRMLRALSENGRGAVVRVCFSVPDLNPPIRTLGYFAAAAHTTQKYLPEAQLQFVATVHANARINHIPLDGAKRTAKQLFNIASSIRGIVAADHTNIVYGFDTSSPPELPMDNIASTLRHEELSKQFARSAARRNAEYIEYVGAHMVLHDSVDVVDSATSYSSSPVSNAEVLISIGAQSERAFYAARHLCKRAPHFSFSGMVENTAQLFTRHVYPPYTYLQYKTENMTDPVLTSSDSVRQLASITSDPFLRSSSIKRDLLYVREQIQDLELLTA